MQMQLKTSLKMRSFIVFILASNNEIISIFHLGKLGKFDLIVATGAPVNTSAGIWV